MQIFRANVHFQVPPRIHPEDGDSKARRNVLKASTYDAAKPGQQMSHVRYKQQHPKGKNL
jgi:hypothetical protein